MWMHAKRATPLVVLLIAAAQADATPKSPALQMLEQMPDRTLLALAWSGCDSVGEDFDATAIGEILAEPEVRSFIDSLKKIVQAEIDKEVTDPADKVAFETLQAAWPILKQSPGVIVVTAGDPKADFAIPFALIVEAAKHREAIDAMLERLKPHIGDVTETQVAGVTMKTVAKDGVCWGWIGTRFAIGVGDLTHPVAALSAEKNVLGASPAYKKRIAAVPGGKDMVVFYVDTGAIGRFVVAASEPGDREVVQKIQAILGVLGLSEVEGILVRMHGRGQNLVRDSAMFAPAPRRGLWECLEGTVGLDRMKQVPADAINAGAGTLRLPVLPALIIDAVRAVDPESAEEFSKEVLDDFEKETGVSIRADVLGNLTGAYTFHACPVLNPLIPQQFAIVLAVQNAAKVDTALMKLDQWAKTQIDASMITEQAQTDGEVSVTLHVWNLAATQVPVQVGWAVCKDSLVIEISPGTIGGAVDHLMSGGPSLADDPTFAAAAKRFPAEVSLYFFSRDAERVSSGLSQLAALWSMLQMSVSREGIVLPPLPPATAITQHLGTTAGYARFDDNAWHSHAAGSMAVGDPVVMAGVAGGAVSVLLPSLSRARELSKRLVSAANLKGIGTCCRIYANENDEKFPPNLQVFIEQGDMTPKHLINPRVADQDTKDHYVYIPGHTEAGESDWVVAYENPEYVEEGINILFLDRHVEFVKGEEAFETIRDTCKRMGLEEPELAYAATKRKSILDKIDPGSAGTKKE